VRLGERRGGLGILDKGTRKRASLTVTTFVTTTYAYLLRLVTTMAGGKLRRACDLQRCGAMDCYQVRCWFLMHFCLTSRRSQVRVLHCPPLIFYFQRIMLDLLRVLGIQRLGWVERSSADCKPQFKTFLDFMSFLG